MTEVPHLRFQVNGIWVCRALIAMKWFCTRPICLADTALLISSMRRRLYMSAVSEGT